MSHDDEVASLSSSLLSQPPPLSREIQCSEAGVTAARVVVLGDRGSGRTSVALAAAKSGSRFRRSSDYRSAIAGSSMTYLYRSSLARRKECMQVSVIDTGSVPLNSGSSRRFLPFCDTVVITFSLTGIKQNYKVSKNIFSFLGSSKRNGGNTIPPVFVHSNDRALLYDLLSIVGARLTFSGGGPRIILIGTFKDLLTYGSPNDVEVLLKELRSICNDYLTLFQQRLLVSAVFAVNSLQGSCVSENRGGPNTVSDMWSFIYDITLKDVVLRQQSISSSSSSLLFNEFRWKSHQSVFSRLMHDSFSDRDEEVMEKFKSMQENKDVSSFYSSQVACSVEPLLDCINVKIVRLIFRAKSERKIVFINLNTLCRLMYSHGLQSKKYLRSMLHQLHNAGEIVLFRYHHESLVSRDSCICIHPHFIDLAQGTIFLYSSYIINHSEKHGKLLTGIDLEECSRCYPYNNISRGVFSQSLLSKLAHGLEISRLPSEATDTFIMLLILSDTVFLRPCRILSLTNKRSTSVSLSPSIEETPLTHVSSSNFIDPNTSINSSENTLSGSENLSIMHSAALIVREQGSVEYVVPSLIRMKCPWEVIDCVRHIASSFSSSSLGEITTEGKNHVISRILALQACPPDFFPMLINRLHRYIDLSAPIFSQALWLCALTPSGETSPFLRMFIYHSTTGESIEKSADEEENYSGLSFLEFYAFSDVGYLPLLFFVDNIITRHVASLVRHEFPGMSTWVTSGVKVNEKKFNGDSVYTGVIRGMEKLSEVNTMWELDVFLKGLDW